MGGGRRGGGGELGVVAGHRAQRGKVRQLLTA